MRLGMTYPLDPAIVRQFADGLEEIVVIEEKRAFVELFVRDALYASTNRPRVVGKTDEHQQRLIPVDGELTADRLSPLLAARMSRRVSTPRMEAHLAVVETAVRLAVEAPLATRKPFFCSGCPHNRSTNLPEGSVTGGGVGCHAMALWMDRGAVNISHMGGEGAQWIGRARFTDREHMFQNIGDGTFFHSGSLAIRASVAAGVNVTYKLLYNRAVAMTGGQDVAGAIPVPQLTHHLAAEGVERIIVCADDVDKYGSSAEFASVADVWQRDRVDEAQRVLRDVPGVTVLVYDQQCAAEKRRDRKRGVLSMPDTRIFINERVCEGCGDCGVKSNCLSVQPVDTEFGRKTRIHQSSCNFDYTCLDGDCPAFVKVKLKRSRRVKNASPATAVASVPQPVSISIGSAPRRPNSDIPEPKRPSIDDVYSIYMTGMGGTGVVTVSQVLATASLLDGFQIFALDQTGLAQKGGPVVSQVKVFRGEPFGSNAVGAGQADVYLGFDLLVAAAPGNLAKALPNRTLAVVSTSHVPTGDMVAHVEASFPDEVDLLGLIANSTTKDENIYLDGNAMSSALFNDHMPANFLILGAAYQAGAIPISAGAIERSIELNGVGVRSNLDAFRWGRRFVVDRTSVPTKAVVAAVQVVSEPSVTELVDRRAAELAAYQNEKLASTYRSYVEKVAVAEQAAVPGSTALTEAVARHLFKLMAYKDEYEVARLYLTDEYAEALDDSFPTRQSVKIQLHPPMLRSLGVQRKIGFGPRSKPVLRLLRSLPRAPRDQARSLRLHQGTPDRTSLDRGVPRTARPGSCHLVGRHN